MSQQRERESVLSEDQLVKILHLKRYESADKERMLQNLQNIKREVRSLQAERKSPIRDWLKAYWGEVCAEPKYGLALALIVFFFSIIQVVGVDRTNSEMSADTNVDFSGLPVEEFPLEEEAYPDLPAHHRLFAPPTGGDGTVLPATFEFE